MPYPSNILLFSDSTTTLKCLSNQFLYSAHKIMQLHEYQSQLVFHRDDRGKRGAFRFHTSLEGKDQREGPLVSNKPEFVGKWFYLYLFYFPCMRQAKAILEIPYHTYPKVSLDRLQPIWQRTARSLKNRCLSSDGEEGMMGRWGKVHEYEKGHGYKNNMDWFALNYWVLQLLDVTNSCSGIRDMWISDSSKLDRAHSFSRVPGLVKDNYPPRHDDLHRGIGLESIVIRNVQEMLWKRHLQT
ncbi:hypothetical protein HPG69_006669 [Diceros bicornis minor]|uniref:Uncharacterized protein n=1 Tax=Diceros bicornis minor TaxID=77932 RepID=A0A7J7F6J8_DICBM|nr:hypothetical protein HPG69_006669 [Diceros bicornis minor]